MARKSRSLLKVGVLAGLLVTVMVFPLVVTGGLSAQATVNAIDRLSVKLGRATPPQTTYVYASDGSTLLSTFYDEFRRNVPLEEVAPVMRQAIVSSEDSRFYEHNGVDPRGVARALAANQSGGGVSQGASTLTMQYVRGALRHNADSAEEVLSVTEETPSRKVREMRLATSLEDHMSKEDIMEGYLNQVYFGHQAYGIYAASYVYFSKAPKDLTLAEGAMLAGMVQAPTQYDPAAKDPGDATERRNWVLERMAKYGYISEKEASDTKSEKIDLDLSRPSKSCMGMSEEAKQYGFFCDYVRQWWRSQSQFGANPNEREKDLRRGGYTIITSIDAKAQKSAQDNVDDAQPRNSQHALGLTSVEPGTGRIQAMAVNRTFKLDQSDNGPSSSPGASARGINGSYPNTVNPLLGGGGVSGYQAGSTFKLFTMLAALEKGLPLSTNIYSPQKVATKYASGAGPASCGGKWCPSNASGSMTGNQTMWSGFGKSVNTYFVQLVERVGADKAVKMAERLGLKWRSSSDQYYADPERSASWGPFTLGVADTTPLEMAGAYATVASEGIYCEPTPILKAIDQNGQEMSDTAPNCHRELSKNVARAATDAARCVTGDGAAKGSCGDWSTADDVRSKVGRSVAGKTGTTNSDRAAWFVGFTRKMAAASFMSDPDNPFNAVGSGNSKKPIKAVAETLRDGSKGEKVKKFNPPSGDLL